MPWSWPAGCSPRSPFPDWLLQGISPRRWPSESAGWRPVHGHCDRSQNADFHHLPCRRYHRSRSRGRDDRYACRHGREYPCDICSRSEDMAKISKAGRTVAGSSKWPIKVTSPRTSRQPACAYNSSRSGPSPTIARRAKCPLSISLAKASISRSIRFSSTSSQIVPIKGPFAGSPKSAS